MRFHFARRLFHCSTRTLGSDALRLIGLVESIDYKSDAWFFRGLPSRRAALSGGNRPTKWRWLKKKMGASPGRPHRNDGQWKKGKRITANQVRVTCVAVLPERGESGARTWGDCIVSVNQSVVKFFFLTFIGLIFFFHYYISLKSKEIFFSRKIWIFLMRNFQNFVKNVKDFQKKKFWNFFWNSHISLKRGNKKLKKIREICSNRFSKVATLDWNSSRLTRSFKRRKRCAVKSMMKSWRKGISQATPRRLGERNFVIVPGVRRCLSAVVLRCTH